MSAPQNVQSARSHRTPGAGLKIVAVLLTEGVEPGERGLDIRGLMTNLCAPIPLRVDFLHATAIFDMNPQDAGPVFPVEIELRDPNNEIIAESRTRTSFAMGIQGSPSVVTFPLGTVYLDTFGPYIVQVRIGSTSGSVAFDLHE